MNDLDQHIRSALHDVVCRAPQPVPVETIMSVGEPGPGAPAARRWPWALALPVAAAVTWLALSSLNSSLDSSPTPTIEVDTVDRGPVGQRPRDGTTPDPARQADQRFTIGEGRWLSELVPSIARQLPDIDEAELWSVLRSTDPVPPLAPQDPIGAGGPPGMTVAERRWEGLLFPTTYSVGSQHEAAEVVARMYQELRRVADELGYRQASETFGLSAYELVVVASLVEAEANTDRDRGKIARVIHNRLAAEMTLSIDTPYIYAAQDRQVEFTQSLLEARGPYGLRTKTGLPPTPISAPGRASLEAAINPTDGPWLFYVVGDAVGNHHFASTFDEHLANVEAARRDGLLD